MTIATIITTYLTIANDYLTLEMCVPAHQLVIAVHDTDKLEKGWMSRELPTSCLDWVDELPDTTVEGYTISVIYDSDLEKWGM